MYNSAKFFSMKLSTLLNVKIGKKMKQQNEYYKLTSLQNFQTTKKDSFIDEFNEPDYNLDQLGIDRHFLLFLTHLRIPRP